jgi:ornithine decarboxylase
MFDHANFPIDSLRSDGERIPSVLAGPTCDSIDIVAENVLLPPLEIGDLIIGRVMGAYCSASATDFNFIRRARVLPVNVTVEIG